MDNKPKELTPADFCCKPWGCVFYKSEHETIARNCMIMLKRTSNTWRELSEAEYVEERLSDGAQEYAAKNELSYFRQVVNYTTSPEQAAKFSPTWATIVANTSPVETDE